MPGAVLRRPARPAYRPAGRLHRILRNHLVARDELAKIGACTAGQQINARSAWRAGSQPAVHAVWPRPGQPRRITTQRCGGCMPVQAVTSPAASRCRRASTAPAADDPDADAGFTAAAAPPSGASLQLADVCRLPPLDGAPCQAPRGPLLQLQHAAGRAEADAEQVIPRDWARRPASQRPAVAAP